MTNERHEEDDMVSRTISEGLGTVALAATLASSAMVAGCSDDPTTMLRVPSNGPYPQAIDERTGVLAVMELLADGRYETSLRRIEDGAYVQLTPPIPDDHSGSIFHVAWFEDGALAGDLSGHLYRFDGTSWQTLSMDACDPSLPGARLEDALAVDDAWVLARDEANRRATLCHFDGATFTRLETLEFVPQELVVLGDRFVASSLETETVLVRPVAGGSWSEPEGLVEIGRTLDDLVVRDEAVFARYGRAGSEDDWWRVTPERADRVSGVPGFGGELWRIDLDETHATRCATSWFDGHEVCHDYVSVADYRVLRVEGAEALEAGVLHLEDTNVTWYVPIVVGPGQLVLAGASGQIYVTDPALLAR